MKLYICDGCGRQWTEDPPLTLRGQLGTRDSEERCFCNVSCVAAWSQRTVEQKAEQPILDEDEHERVHRDRDPATIYGPMGAEVSKSYVPGGV